MWSLSFLLFVLVLVSCSSTTPTNPTPTTPETPSNPYAAYGCLESPNMGSQPRVLYDVELGKPYELQGGSYQLMFDLPVPSRIRVTLSELDPYDNLSLILADTIDINHIVTYTHNAGPGSTEDGPALESVVLESKEQLEVTVGFTVNRSFSDNTLRNDEGKQLFCQTYTVVIERIL
ncbi:MAG: hypothetical protein ACRCYY_16730 [Trueperaceae bacterium]